MRIFSRVILLPVIVALFAATAITQQTQQPQFKLVEFHMAILKRGPSWSAPSIDQQALHQQHVAFVVSMLESGKAVIAGAIRDDNNLVGIYIFRAKSAEEARAWAQDDPAVKAGLVTAEMHPWWSEDVMKKTSTPLKLTTAYLAFLTRGEKWTPEKTAASEELQKRHLENIKKLADMKKLVVAGPFGDDGTLRGIFVFKVDSLAEAQALAATDPAVQAGRLALDIHPWVVSEGILP